MERVSDKVVTVRKERRCFGCLELIKKGDKAHSQTNTEDGKIYTLTVCMPCMDYVNEQRIECYGEGELLRSIPKEKAGE